jgi:integrase
MATFKQYETKKGKLWEVRGYLGVNPLTGESHKLKKRGFETKKEAQHYFNNAKLQFDNGLSVKKPVNRTFQEVYEEWLPLYAMNVEKSTLNKTEQYFRLHILPVFGNDYINKITSRKLQTTVNDWHKRYESYRKLYNYTCKVFDYALSYGYILEHPKTRIILPSKKIDHATSVTAEFYSKDELAQFLEYANGYSRDVGHSLWYTYFRILAFTGVRRGEALALSWQDISFKDKTLRVNKSLKQGAGNRVYIGEPKTKAGYRVISLDDNTLTILRRWKVEQARLLLGFGYSVGGNNQLIFSKMDNTPLDLSAPRNRLETICKKHNFKMINVHGFRHTHCSLLFEAGVPMKDVKERLGHSDITTTMNIYTHVTDSSRDNSAQLFAKYANF